jgi:hypothetical protein
MIESTIATLPRQGQIMLKLLLLQHYDVDQEDIEYMAADRPDPRCQAGTKPLHRVLTHDAIKAVWDRRDQYRRQVRLRRERTWLQTQCLSKVSAVCEALARQAEELLCSRYGLSSDQLAALRQGARTAIPKPAIRRLEQQWDNEEISAEDYQKHRLTIEFQTQLRLAEKYRKRLDLSDREWKNANSSPLQDHEIGHIWGIPAGTLAARKVKYLHHYIQGLQQNLRSAGVAAITPSGALDLWNETLRVLAERPVERSVATYDGLERTEAALLDRLHAFAWGTLPEEIEGKFWLSLVHGATTNAVHSEPNRTLFGLQQLAAILNETDLSPEAMERELLARTAPKPKEALAAIEGPAPPASEGQLNEMQEHILRSFIGEDRGAPLL